MKAKAASFDSDSVSNQSPLTTQKKVRPLRHANTLAADAGKHGSQSTFENDVRPKAVRNHSNIVGVAGKGAKKMKVMTVHEPSSTDNYSV